MTFTRGKVTVGKIAEGRRVAVQMPAAQSTARRRKRAAGRSEKLFAMLNAVRRFSSLSGSEELALGKPDQTRDDHGLAHCERRLQDLGFSGIRDPRLHCHP